MKEMNKDLLFSLKGLLFFYRAILKCEEVRRSSEGLLHLVDVITELSTWIDNCKDLSDDQLRKLLKLISSSVFDHLIVNPISSPMNIDLFDKKRLIGSGGYGFVYVGINSGNGALCAIKEPHNIDDRSALDLDKEIQLLCQLHHPNIVVFYGSKIVESQVSLYMEYVLLGSLKTCIESLGAFPEGLVRHFTAQILSGLAFLHSREVVHRDIKPGNLLVDSRINIKIADLGLAKRLTQSVDKHSVDGTFFYAAPEVIMKKDINSHGQACAADIWSLGCVVIEMFTGKHPFPDCSHGAQVVYKVCCRNQHPPIPENLSLEGILFLKQCFTRDPAKRPSAVDLLSHPFVTTNIGGRKLLRYHEDSKAQPT